MTDPDDDDRDTTRRLFGTEEEQVDDVDPPAPNHAPTEGGNPNRESPPDDMRTVVRDLFNLLD